MVFYTDEGQVRKEIITGTWKLRRSDANDTLTPERVTDPQVISCHHNRVLLF